MQEPYMKQLTLTLNTSAYNLYTLLQAAAPSGVTVRKVCCELHIQDDLTDSTHKIFIGNSALTPGSGGADTGWDTATVGGEFKLGPLSSNLIHLDQIYLTSDTSGVVVNVTAITR